MEVVERDDLVAVHEPLREGRRDKTRAARDEDPLAAQSHAASLTAEIAFPPLAGALHDVATFGTCASPGSSPPSPPRSPVPPTPGDGLPTWSPDGSVIVFLSSRNGATLRVVNPDGTGERQLPWLATDGSYSFSPDWSHIAFQDASNHMIVERL
ncbi:MAG: hypothetical protein E6G33_15575, partial [Actinobacteria bacterium]